MKPNKKDRRIRETEHPKPLTEVMENSLGAVEGYAAAKKLNLPEAALVLVLNELRCIHWHLDAEMAREVEASKGSKTVKGGEE